MRRWWGKVLSSRPTRNTVLKFFRFMAAGLPGLAVAVPLNLLLVEVVRLHKVLAYVLAWVAGFLTPGVPAGLGVREVVLLFLFRGLVHEADFLLAVVMSRVVTIAGDVLFFGLASLIRPEEQQES